MSKNRDKWADELRKLGLRYPGAHIKSPWPGHADLAVNDKTFAYLSASGEPFSISCKLPQSHEVALGLPGAVPTAYGLGRSGWVSLTPGPKDDLPLEMFTAWIDESYRAQAPKKLVKELDAASGGRPAAERTVAPSVKKRAPTKKTPAKKAQKTASTRRR